MTVRRREILVAAGLTALYLLARGYVFGMRDHGIHLAYIERAADPGFLPGDPLLDVAGNHPTFFFPSLAWLARLVPLEAIYLVAYLLSVFAVILALRSLSRRLWEGPAGEWAATVAVAGVIVHRYVGGSIENLDAMFLPRVASLGPLLYALSLGARGRFPTAFLLAGAVFLIHAPTAAHTAFVLWVGCALGGRANLRRCLLGPVLFLAAAAPLLVMMGVHGGSGIPTPAPEAWVRSLKLHFAFHHFPVPGEIVRMIVPAIVAVFLGVAVSRWYGAGRLLTGYLAGGCGLLVAGGVGNWLLVSPLTIHLHLFEAGRLIDCLAVVALGRWTYWAAHRSKAVQIGAAVVAASYVIRISLHEWLDFRLVLDFYLLSAALAVTLLVRYEQRVRRLPGAARALAGWLRGRGAAPSLRRGWVLAAVFGLVLVVASGRVPRWSFDGSNEPGYRMMRWAGQNLPERAVVIIPPYMDELVCSFRYFARRQAVGSWKDGGEGTFHLAFQLAWERRVRDITGVGDHIRVPDRPIRWPEYAAWVAEAMRSYHEASAAHFVGAAKRHGATHVVREAGSPPLSLPVDYRDDEYVLYRCGAGESGAAHGAVGRGDE